MTSPGPVTRLTPRRRPDRLAPSVRRLHDHRNGRRRRKRGADASIRRNWRIRSGLQQPARHVSGACYGGTALCGSEGQPCLNLGLLGALAPVFQGFRHWLPTCDRERTQDSSEAGNILRFHAGASLFWTAFVVRRCAAAKTVFSAGGRHQSVFFFSRSARPAKGRSAASVKGFAPGGAATASPAETPAARG